jgi:hypothetical protein
VLLAEQEKIEDLKSRISKPFLLYKIFRNKSKQEEQKNQRSIDFNYSFRQFYLFILTALRNIALKISLDS